MALDDDVVASLRRPVGYTPPPPGVDPYEAAATASLRRPVVITPEQQAAAVQDTTSQTGRGFRQSLGRLGSAGEALYGAGANLVSPGAGDEALESAIGMQRRSAEGGPRVQTYADVHGLGDAADYAAGMVGSAVPDVALALAGGGVGGAAVKGLARRVGLEAAESYVARKAAESGAESVARGAVERVAPRFVQAAEAAAEPAVAAGRAAGTVAGQYPSVVAGSVEGAPDANGNLVGGLKGASAADTAKILAGDFGAATLGALPEIRLLGRIGGTAAEQAIAKNAQAILPRVAKEAATQGALGAGLGVAQTAAQFAAHKWVDDNVDLISPHAFQSYLDSALAGGALGAGLGGAVEGGAALGARVGADGAPNPQWDALKGKIRDNLAKAGEARDQAFAKARSAFANGEEGQPIGGDARDAQEPSPKTANEQASDVGTKIGEGAAKVHQAAVDIFTKLNSALSTDEGRAATSRAFAGAVDSLKSRFDAEPLQAGIEAVFKSYRDALDGAKTPEAQADVQKAHGEVIDGLIREQSPDATQSFSDNLNRLQDTAELDDRADAVLANFSKRFESGEADALAPNDRSPAQNPVRFDTKLQDQLGAAIPTDAPIWAFPEAMKPLMSSAEKLFTGGELSAHDHRNIDILRRYAPDTVDTWEAAGPDYARLSKGVDEHGPTAAESEAQGHSDATLTQRLEQAPLGSDEHQTLQAELRNRMFRQGGDARTGGPLVENQSSPEARQFWATKDPTKNANVVGVGTREIKTKGGTAQRIEALQLDNLISKKLAEEPGTGPIAALKSVLGDLHQAGIKVDPETITPGTFYTQADGTPFRLSPRDAANLRAGLKQPSSAAKVEERAPAAPGEPAPIRPIEVDRPAETANGDEGSQANGPELVPRKAPPATQGGIADVRTQPSPYAATVTEARKAYAAAKTPRERAQVVHEAGTKIGTAELAKEREAGTISERRFAAETRRLNDPESGLSRKYFNDEVSGKFDRGSVRETAPDAAEPTPREALRREADDAFTSAYQRMTGDSAAKVPRKALEAAARDVEARRAAGEDLAPKERTFFSAARDAGLIKGKETGKSPPVPEPVKLHDTHEAVEEIVLSSEHDHKAEAAALNDTLERMGIKDKVTVGSDERFGAGSYDTNTRRIHVGDGLKGAERIEVLAHELGHHIIRSELAKATGVKLKDTAHLTMDQVFDRMAEHQPELHAAINADFEKWMEQHSDLNERYVDALASRKAVNRAEAIRGKTDDRTLRYVAQVEPAQLKYTHSFEEYVADQISRALTHNEKSPVAKFFKGLADKLKLAYDSLFGGKGGADYAPAPSVEKWIQSLFDRTTQDVSAALGEPVPAKTARTATEAALHAAAAQLPPAGAPPPNGGGRGASPSLPPKGLKSLVQFIRYRLPADSRAILDGVLSRGKATQALDKAYADQPGALKAMRDPKHAIEARIAYAILAARDGKVNLGPGATGILSGLSDDLLSIANLSGDGAHAERVFADIENGRIESTIAAGKTYDVRAREAAYRGRAQSALNETRTVYDKVKMPLTRAFSASVSRMRDTGVPAIRKVGALLQRHTGEAGEDPGLSPAVTHVTDRLMRSAGRIFEGLNEREVLHTLTALQRQDAGTHNNRQVATAVERTRDLFNELHKYGVEAGIFEKGQRRENYFPVLLDLKTDADRAKLSTLLSQPKFESAIRDALNDHKVPIDELVARMVGEGQGGGATGPADFRAKNYRLMNFVYALGDDADKATFASLQSKSPADIIGRYVQPLVREAEFTRRFGADGTKLESLLAEAKKQGATDADLAQTRSAVDGAMGRVGTDGSPVLQTLLGKNLADRIATPGARKGISYAQAYQNARLLPLSLLSSLVDPMGIAVRTGGDFKTAWDGFKVGMKSLVDKQTKAEMQAMLRSLGSADDFLANDILASGFGTKDSGGARKINDLIFHANGLAGWTKTTRFMALQAAHGFLAKHGDGASPTSKRYLDELGLRPGDVTIENGRAKVLEPAARELASAAERARDERVRSALLRFVDESILRPTAQQAPNWYADPYVGLVTQYKHFAYAIADQIGSRIAHEIRHGNASVLAPAMSYLPIIIAAEMLRGGIQYGPGGNPNRKDWGPEDYTTYALDRSGLLGPRISFAADAVGDTKRGNAPGTSFLGPTAAQASQTLRGRGDIESALPGEALYKHWTSGENNEQRATASR